MMEFMFEASAWEQVLEALNPGDTINALELMSLIEEEDEDGGLSPRPPCEGGSRMRIAG